MDFEDFTRQQQATIIQDRYRACFKKLDSNGNSIENGDADADRAYEYYESNRSGKSYDDIFNELNALANIPRIAEGSCEPAQDEEEGSQ